MRAGTNYVVGGILVFGAYYLGLYVTQLFDLPLPGPLAGLLFLLVFLFLFPLYERHVAAFATAPLKHMSLLFVPAVLSVTLYWSDIQQNSVALSIAIVVTTVLSLGVTAWLSQALFASKQSPVHPSTTDNAQDNKDGSKP
ncbi:hypothetical protein D210916BOD24_05580 [Alteromonas sp. D210916BOD_24]|uniref:CidA/LrgA family protein n=1 Tax=Alteromonas sp. D210916BOD_24 TaxID=3157618 RepID=UPI00399C9A0E